MASLILLRNPLTPHYREQFEIATGSQVIDWLQERYPDGFGMPIKFYVNTVEKELDDLDYRVEEDDVVVIALMPADPVSLTIIGVGLLISAALAAATYFLIQSMMPKENKGRGQTNTAYSVSSDQNAARLGEAIPVVYGRVRTTPDYVSQPYSLYQFDQSVPAVRNPDALQQYLGKQFLNMLLCVSQGEVEIENILFGDTEASSLIASDSVRFRAFKPHEHQSRMGVISSLFGGYVGFHENVVTSPEVSSQEFVYAWESAGLYAATPPGVRGSLAQIDIVFPAGQQNPSKSNLKGRATYFTVGFTELNDAGQDIGGGGAIQIKTTTIGGDTYTPQSNVWIAPGARPRVWGTDETNATKIASPLRRTYNIPLPRSARWAFRIVRETDAPNANNGHDRFMWAGLRMFADYPTTPVYGDVTLLAVSIRAGKGLGTDASVRISTRAIRRLVPVSGAGLVPTTSPADAFQDVYTNRTYGANRPLSEVDVATLASLRAKWAGYEFNHAFRDRTTVWDALRTVTTPMAAEPLPLGQVLSVAQDGVKLVRSALFTDANIVEGSLRVTYSFDEVGASDGVEIEWFDPKDFKSQYAIWPPSSLRPDRYTLPGCTTLAHASQYARLIWQRRQYQRKSVSFETELEGLLLQMGDGIGVSHSLPKWGQGGQVLLLSGNTIVVDTMLDWSGSSHQVILRRRDGTVTDPVTVTRGSTDDSIVFPGAVPAGIFVDAEREFTMFAFGTVGKTVSNFVVTAIKPVGENRVAVEAINYDSRTYDGAMTFLR